VPAQSAQVYVATQVTVHEIPLASLTPGTLYFYRVTSCNKKGCTIATGSFETFPSCPDVVPAVSGNWQNVTSPNVSGATELNNELLGVAAISANEAWAVGWSQDPNGPQYVKRTLIQHFTGAWDIVNSPNRRGDTLSQLYSVAAVSANNVWAVGSSQDGSLPRRTLVQHWDGTQWSLVSSPSPDKQFNELRGVAALSANDVWAVGYRGGTKSETPIETFILHWNGTTWTQVVSPNIPGGANQLFGVTAISANDIWAVGSVAGAPLALHWNGSTWNLVNVEVGSGLSTAKLTAVPERQPTMFGPSAMEKEFSLTKRSRRSCIGMALAGVKRLAALPAVQIRLRVLKAAGPMPISLDYRRQPLTTCGQLGYMALVQ
jgi:hypothetical protein